jgi:ubiquitin-protein ligase
MSLLRDAHSPVVTVINLIMGMLSLFYEPNPNDPLNGEAAQQWRNNYEAFKCKAEDYREQYASDES